MNNSVFYIIILSLIIAFSRHAKCQIHYPPDEGDYHIQKCEPPYYKNGIKKRSLAYFKKINADSSLLFSKYNSDRYVFLYKKNGSTFLRTPIDTQKGRKIIFTGKYRTTQVKMECISFLDIYNFIFSDFIEKLDESDTEYNSFYLKHGNKSYCRCIREEAAGQYFGSSKLYAFILYSLSKETLPCVSPW